MGSYQKRFFQLRDNELTYGENENSVKGSFMLVEKKSSATFDAPGNDGADYFYFDIFLPDGSRKVQLYADREAERRKWFDALEQVGTPHVFRDPDRASLRRDHHTCCGIATGLVNLADLKAGKVSGYKKIGGVTFDGKGNMVLRRFHRFSTSRYCPMPFRPAHVHECCTVAFHVRPVSASCIHARAPRNGLVAKS